MSDKPSELDALMDEAALGDGHKKKARRRGAGHEHVIRELNLVAMMDMMTIILVFLIKNFATDPENVTLDSNLQPPRSTTKIPMEVAVMVTITKTGLAVNDKPLLNFSAPGSFALKGEEPNTPNPITQLQEILDKQVADMKRLEAKGGSRFEGKILIVADEKTPYSFLMRVLYTAGLSQFSQYKLVVRAKEVGPAKPAAPH